MLSGEVLGGSDHLVQGVGLVVGEIGHDRCDGALRVEKLGVPRHGVADLCIDDALVVADGGPLRVAFEHPRRIGPHRVRQRQGALHARHLRQTPTETIDFGQGFVGSATILTGFHHHREQVAGDAVV
ncbi:hypothetical protein FQZ97_1114240 [compost metagenome]